MKVNKELMTKARFERKLISELTVKEFRELTREMMHNAFRFEEEQKYIQTWGYQSQIRKQI